MLLRLLELGQYTSWIFGHRLREAGLLGSMGRVASSVDNTMMESFWSTLQRELLDRQRWETRAELSSAIFEWIEAFYNQSAGTRPSVTSARSSSKHFTPPLKLRHDHNNQPVRESGSGSRGPHRACGALPLRPRGEIAFLARAL